MFNGKDKNFKVKCINHIFSSVLQLNFTPDKSELCNSKNWCFWTVVLEKTLESPLDSKEIQPVNSKGNRPWIFIGRTEAETPILWPPDEKSWLIEKILMLGKIEGGRRREWQRMRWLVASPTQWTWVWASSGSWWWTGRPDMLRFMGSQSRTQLSNWTELKYPELRWTCYIDYFVCFL